MELLDRLNKMREQADMLSNEDKEYKKKLTQLLQRNGYLSNDDLELLVYMLVETCACT